MKVNKILVVALAACGGQRGPGGGGGGGADSGNPQDCSDTAKLVYVLDVNHTLSQFDPLTKTFHDLGPLHCPAQSGSTPFSMAIDRTATAYVLYSSGELFKVDTSSLACTKTAWMPQIGLVLFGMGFSTDQVNGNTDTLYVAGGVDYPPVGLTIFATVDLNTFTATRAGAIDGCPKLTGTSSAELWGFIPFPSVPSVERLDKTSGTPTTTYQQSSLNYFPKAWAFAFWGGDFWAFLAAAGHATVIYQIDGASGAIKSTTQTERTITGAGVSTCAPIVIE
jgi:hypothetical protein